MRGHVDEVVVVDTGSVDATREIVTSHGARLLHYAWNGDFSAARNCALDAVSADWVLYIDADERLVPVEGTALREVVAAPGHAAFQMRFRPRIGYSPYDELRLFRSDPRIRFEMRIHERVLPSVLRVCESDGLAIGRTVVGLQHLGYEGDQSHKHVRNLPMLVHAVDDDPDRVYYWWHLGETLAGYRQDRRSGSGFAHRHRNRTENPDRRARFWRRRLLCRRWRASTSMPANR